MLYPLSYRGGDGAKRGAKLRCWVRPHVWLRLSACFAARPGPQQSVRRPLGPWESVSWKRP